VKEAVLRLLKERRPGRVSGEEICQKLNVTRTAVWKQIRGLRRDGYNIVARPRAGYLLAGVPDRLYPEEILDGLGTAFVGRQVFYRETVLSTNDLAKELARGGVPEGTLVVAEEQSGGRGRMGRAWHSPAGAGLWFSLVLFPPVNPSDASQLTMLTAVAATRAVRSAADVPAVIKWPNDLLVKNKKVVGILTELSAEMDRVNYLVVGVGINVNQEEADFPEEIRRTATSLKIETGRRLCRLKLLRAVLVEFERWYSFWLKEGFAPVLAAWKELSVTVKNCPVRAVHLNDTWDGLVEDVDESGALLLRLPDGRLQRLVAGEVSLRL